MRYNVHPPHAFRNRIAKSIGVLVAAALVAVLGLPTAAQAQMVTPTIRRSDDWRCNAATGNRPIGAY